MCADRRPLRLRYRRCKRWSRCARRWPFSYSTAPQGIKADSAPLSCLQAVQEVATLRQAVASAEANRAALGSSKARLAACERQLKAVEWENEVLAQRLEVVSLCVRLGGRMLGCAGPLGRVEWENEVLAQRLKVVTPQGS